MSIKFTVLEPDVRTIDRDDLTPGMVINPVTNPKCFYLVGPGHEFYSFVTEGWYGPELFRADTKFVVAKMAEIIIKPVLA